MNTLFDNHGRPLNYLRLAVTDRCNLRCFYCMPQDGIQLRPKKDLLTFEEIIRLVKLMASMGISKIRLTGGEPFLRKDLMRLIQNIVEIPGVKDLHLTTNGILTAPHIPELKRLGIASVNLSLDTLDPDRFLQITRKDEFKLTYQTLERLIEHDIPVKINTVVMRDKNIDDIIPLAELARHSNLSVRFIEEMPFNGGGEHAEPWSYKQIRDYLQAAFPDMVKMTDPENSTAYYFKIPGFRGTIGIIAAFSRTFCGTCNRIRITSQGIVKTCLYDEGVLDIRSLLRNGSDDAAIRAHLIQVFNNRALNGFEAEARRKDLKPAHESMSTIGG